VKKEELGKAIEKVLGVEPHWTSWCPRNSILEIRLTEDVAITLAMFQALGALFLSFDIDVAFARETDDYSEVTPGDGATFDIRIKNVGVGIEDV
jgi:hypothetical protein